MKSLQTYNSRINFDDKGFLKIAFNSIEDEIDIDEIKQQINACYIITKDKITPVLVDLRSGKKTISDEAKLYAGKNNPYNHLKSAEALLINSLAQRAIANFFIKFSRQLYPSKIFTKEDEAIAWLLTFVKK